MCIRSTDFKHHCPQWSQHNSSQLGQFLLSIFCGATALKSPVFPKRLIITVPPQMAWPFGHILGRKITITRTLKRATRFNKLAHNRAIWRWNDGPSPKWQLLQWGYHITGWWMVAILDDFPRNIKGCCLIIPSDALHHFSEGWVYWPTNQKTSKCGKVREWGLCYCDNWLVILYSSHMIRMMMRFLYIHI